MLEGCKLVSYYIYELDKIISQQMFLLRAKCYWSICLACSTAYGSCIGKCAWGSNILMLLILSHKLKSLQSSDALKPM